MNKVKRKKMSSEFLCETHEMTEIIELAKELIKCGATLEQIKIALEFAIYLK